MGKCFLFTKGVMLDRQLVWACGGVFCLVVGLETENFPLGCGKGPHLDRYWVLITE